MHGTLTINTIKGKMWPGTKYNGGILDLSRSPEVDPQNQMQFIIVAFWLVNACNIK